jgi:tetratricopeptide (TPR) repeat protein
LNSIPEGVKKSWNKKEDLLNQSDEMALKADLLAFESRYEEADQYYEKALQLNPSNANLWAFKGINLSGGLNRDDDARKAWENAKRLDPVLADALDVQKIEKEEGEEFSSPVLCGMPDNIRDKIKQLMKKQKEQLDSCK